MSCIKLKSRLKKYKVPEGYVLPRRCPICQRSFSITRPHQFDHDHDTDEFRSVLCLHCNSILAFAQDDIKVLKRAIKYLVKHGQ